jgi:hypothetical protein
MDVEPEEFYSRVRDAYLGIARHEPDRFRVIAAQLATVRSFFDAYVSIGDESFPGDLAARHPGLLQVIEGPAQHRV